MIWGIQDGFIQDLNASSSITMRLMDDNECLIVDIVELHMLVIRALERHHDVFFESVKQYDILFYNTTFDLDILVVTGVNASITYKQCVDNLLTNAKRFNIDQFTPEHKNKPRRNLINEITLLQQKLKDTPVGIIKPFTRSTDEYALHLLELARLKYVEMQTNMLTVPELNRITGISHSTIKTACMDYRLLNTRRSGATWLINYKEFKRYFSN